MQKTYLEPNLPGSHAWQAVHIMFPHSPLSSQPTFKLIRRRFSTPEGWFISIAARPHFQQQHCQLQHQTWHAQLAQLQQHFQQQA